MILRTHLASQWPLTPVPEKPNASGLRGPRTHMLVYPGMYAYPLTYTQLQMSKKKKKQNSVSVISFLCSALPSLLGFVFVLSTCGDHEAALRMNTLVRILLTCT